MTNDLLDPSPAAANPAGPEKPGVPCILRRGDRLLLLGDSITEARRYTRMLETYLTVCLPGLEVEVRNLGKGGETAAGFLGRIEAECLNHGPAAATVCYGMNDSGYVNDNREAAAEYRAAIGAIVGKLKAAGARVVLGSPGCVGRLPPWPFVEELGCTLDGINRSLMYIRDEAAAVAGAEALPFVDHFSGLYRARLLSAEKYGDGYAVCGADDGVHPSWAGHVVMAYGFFQALGFDGDLGTFAIDLAGGWAKASPGHAFAGEKEGVYTFESARYPFCAEGPVDRDWSIRSGMTLVPFNRDFNRMSLRVTGAAAPRYRVAWTDRWNALEEWHVYTAQELAAGVNLAEDFQLNPFSAPFRRIDDLIMQKQAVEAEETWHVWEREGIPAAEGLAAREERRAELRRAIGRAFVPVVHNIRLEPLA